MGAQGTAYLTICPYYPWKLRLNKIHCEIVIWSLTIIFEINAISGDVGMMGFKNRIHFHSGKYNVEKQL